MSDSNAKCVGVKFNKEVLLSAALLTTATTIWVIKRAILKYQGQTGCCDKKGVMQGCQLFLILQKTSWFAGEINQSGYTNMTTFLILKIFWPLNYMSYKESSWLVKRVFLIARCLCRQLCVMKEGRRQPFSFEEGAVNKEHGSYPVQNSVPHGVFSCCKSVKISKVESSFSGFGTYDTEIIWDKALDLKKKKKYNKNFWNENEIHKLLNDYGVKSMQGRAEHGCISLSCYPAAVQSSKWRAKPPTSFKTKCLFCIYIQYIHFTSSCLLSLKHEVFSQYYHVTMLSKNGPILLNPFSSITFSVNRFLHFFSLITGLVDDQQKVRTITALALAALAEAATPYGIESFDSVLKPLWKGIRQHRGKVRSSIQILTAMRGMVKIIVPRWS